MLLSLRQLCSVELIIALPTANKPRYVCVFIASSIKVYTHPVLQHQNVILLENSCTYEQKCNGMCGTFLRDYQ